MSDNKPKQLSASEKITRLEDSTANLYVTTDNMARDLLLLKDSSKLIAYKLNAVVELMKQGKELSDENIATVMTEYHRQDLASRVQAMVNTGGLKAVDEVPAESGFVVVRELDDEGNVTNPRLQVRVSAQPEEVQNALIGKKAGDVVTIAEGKDRVEVLETYQFVHANAPEQSA